MEADNHVFGGMTKLGRGVESAEPSIVIGQDESGGGFLMFDVTDVEQVPRGGLAVANGGANEILLFDSTGAYVGKWGGAGEGPGEFLGLSWLGMIAPDTVVAADARLRRVTFFDVDGAVAHSVEMVDVGRHLGRLPPRPLALLADGWLTATFSESLRPREGSIRPSVHVVGIQRNTGEVYEIGTWPDDELTLYWNDSVLEVVGAPLGRRLHFAVTESGLWIGDDAVGELRQYSGNGELLSVVRWVTEEPEVTEEDVARWVAAKYRYARESRALEELMSEQLARNEHRTLPSFWAIQGRDGDRIAIAQNDVYGEGGRRWVTVDLCGALTVTVLPANMDVKRWKAGWVVGIVRDRVGREEVHAYRISEEVSVAGSSECK